MPEVGIYPSLEINAFATGPTRNSALVAVSEGILRHMDRAELEGVLGHEVSHAANGDMVTMTLVQGVVNSFVIFVSWLASIAISNAMRRDDREGGLGDYFLRSMIHNLLQVLFSLIAYVLVVAPYSRWREYRADHGGAELVGRRRMIAGLQALKDTFRVRDQGSDPALAAFKVSGGMGSFFSTHPDLDDRIARLKQDASLPA
jgi:heat shock protein HtpX